MKQLKRVSIPSTYLPSQLVAFISAFISAVVPAAVLAVVLAVITVTATGCRQFGSQTVPPSTKTKTVAPAATGSSLEPILPLSSNAQNKAAIEWQDSDNKKALAKSVDQADDALWDRRFDMHPERVVQKKTQGYEFHPNLFEAYRSELAPKSKVIFQGLHGTIGDPRFLGIWTAPENADLWVVCLIYEEDEVPVLLRREVEVVSGSARIDVVNGLRAELDAMIGRYLR